MVNTRQPAKNLTCLFKDIVNKYPESQLAPCKTDSWTWKHASSHAAVERIIGLAEYFPELINYNQIVATDNFCENFFNLATKKNKRLWRDDRIKLLVSD